MERAARLIKNKKISGELLSEGDIASAAWASAVGKAIAAHTSRVRLVRTTLVVEVEDAIWQRQLHALSGQILGSLRKLIASDQIKDIEFRIGIPRRQAQRAGSLEGHATGGDGQDEAERIEDPMLQKLYRRSRKKASA